MPNYGVTPAGFVAKPLSAILSDMQGQVLATVDPKFDLSPQTPDGQMLGIYAQQSASLWALAQAVFNQFNRQDVEGAAADNLGDITGTPRQGQTYTQVYTTCTLAAGTYAAGTLICNVTGQNNFTFSNLNSVTSVGGATTVLMQSTVAGPTPTVNAGTLTTITSPVSGWTAVTNPTAQTQLGTNAELDAAYVARQAQQVAGQGSSNPSATAAALIALGAAQSPPQTLTPSVVENTSATTSLQVGSLILPPNSYAVFVYDGGTGWALGAGQSLIAQTIWNNKPAGNTPVGTTSANVTDPNLGIVTVSYTVPVAKPLFITATVVPRANVTFAALVTAIQTALVAAAVAPTPASGTPPNGQLIPGSPVIGSQIYAVLQAVPGVFDVKSLTFDFSANPVNTNPLTVDAAHIATISAATVSTNVVINQGGYP